MMKRFAMISLGALLIASLTAGCNSESGGSGQESGGENATKTAKKDGGAETDQTAKGPTEQKPDNKESEDKAEPRPEPENKADGASAGAPPRVALETSMGRIVIELNPEKAPGTVENFLTYVDEGFYDDTIFHRVMPTFMIQGGGFLTINRRKTDGLNDPIRNEADNGLKNKRGTIAMARTGDPHSATAQFFINVKDNPPLDHRAKNPRGWGYCVFGKVVEGMDVVDKIKNVETKNRPMGGGRMEKSEPIDPPIIQSATRVTD
jgi:cyclophilin family peptidyl-prolyl cis-trans isomerase/predicted small secreted protein